MNPDLGENTVLEKSRSSDRIRDVRNLTLFTLAIGAIAIISMDIIIYPITMFAIHSTKVFSVLVRYFSLAIIIFLIVGILARRIYFLHKNGLSAQKIVVMMLRAPLRHLASFFFALFAIALTCVIIYVLLNYNNAFLYHLSSSL